MLVRTRRTLRPAATTVEMAVVAPVFVLFIFGLLVLGLGVFRYNQMAYLAREGARYASVRGIDSWRDTAIPSATPTQIRDHVRSKAAGLDRTKVTVNVTYLYPGSNTPPPYPPPVRWTNPTTGQTRINFVEVTVSFPWVPETILTGPINLTSTSRMPMAH